MEVSIVWKEINERLTNFVYGKTKDSELTKDIVQNVFLKMFSNIETLRNKDKIVSWIYQIARNEVVTHFRRIKSAPLVKEVELLEISNETFTAEVSQCLHPLINSLPKKYKEALILADIEKISQKELAKRLNISYSGAKSRVQRGREMLKLKMQECCTITTDVYGDVLNYQIKEDARNKIKECNIDCD